MADHEQGPGKHEWQQYRAPYKNGNHFWSTWGRLLLSFILGGLSAAFFLGGKSRDISDLLTWKGEAKSTLERLDSRMWNVEGDKGQIQQSKEKMAELEKKVEPIGAMQSKIERLERDVSNHK